MNILRPRSFDEYIGQENIKKLLKISVEAAKSRNEMLDHILLSGPPGLGKTTIASILAYEMGKNFKFAIASALQKPIDLVGLLTSIDKEGSVLFIDEIHRLPKNLEEILYVSMEDYIVDISVSKGIGAQSVRLNLPPFTLICATTKPGSLSSPLIDRFGIHGYFEFYQEEELSSIIKRSAEFLELEIEEEASIFLAKRSRFTPRVANKLLRRVRDYVQVNKIKSIDILAAAESLKIINIDNLGLNDLDRKYLHALKDIFKGGPAGIDNISQFLGESPETIEDLCEPYLLKIDFVQRTPRGRVLTENAINYLDNSFCEKSI
jgi:Holliday junction DNA helicase RuvB